jgi:hypothetical protein
MIYCYVRLFATYGPDELWTWLSILLALVFVVEAIFSLTLEITAERAISTPTVEH